MRIERCYRVDVQIKEKQREQQQQKKQKKKENNFQIILDKAMNR